MQKLVTVVPKIEVDIMENIYGGKGQPTWLLKMLNFSMNRKLNIMHQACMFSST